MSTVRSVLNAPIKVIRRIASLKNHPIKTGVAALALDQAAKLTVKNSIPLNTKSCLVDNLICLEHSLNPGTIFGLSSEYPSAMKIAVGVATASLAGLFIKVKSKVTKLALSFIVSGSISNLIDRVVHNGTIDYIRTSPWPWPWNAADAFLYAGGFLLLYEGLTRPGQAQPQEPLGTATILKNSFTKNKWNTIGQTLLYAFSIFCMIGYGLAYGIIPALLFSMIRDVRHNGERMF